MDAEHAVPPTNPPAAHRPLSPTAAIGAGWRAFLARPWLSLGVTVVLMAVMCVGELVPFVNLLFAALVAPALYAGAAWFFLCGIRGQNPTFETAFEGFRRWSSATAALLIMIGVSMLIMIPVIGAVITTIGLTAILESKPDRFASLANAIPLPLIAAMVVTYPVLFWWSARAHMVLFTVMEPDRPGPMEALRRSLALTRGSVWRIIGLYLLCIPVVMLGLLAACVGILPAIIVMYYAFAHAYEQLKQRAA